MFKIN